jgi:hypothetical protein
LRFLFKLLTNLLNHGLIRLFSGRLLYNLEHFHETLRPHANFIQDVLLHANIMRLMYAEKGTLRTNSLLAIDADNLDLAPM